MRLAILALSAAAISGCSWMGGGHYDQHAQYSQSGVNCVQGAQGGYGYQQTQYGYAADPNCVGGMYGTPQPAYAQQGYGTQAWATPGYDTYSGHMEGAAATAHTASPYGTQSYAASGYQTTTLGASAPYGSAVGGAYGVGNPYGQNVVGTQYSDGQYVQGAGVQQVMGSPIYVAQPYAAPYAAGVGGCGAVSVPCGVGGGALPWGIELDAGTEFDIGGDIFTDKPSGPADDDPTTGIEVGAIDGISYDDAFGQSKSIGGTLGYDVSRQTTLLGTVGYSKADGQTISNYTTVESGTYAGTPPVFTPDGSGPQSLDIAFSDLEQFSIEGGIRQYVGRNPSLRPYVGATAGFTHNNDVNITQTFASDGSLYNEQQYIQSGWNPTASAVLGAEMAVGPRAAIGVESGIRWRDNMDTVLESEDRFSIPLKLRGRVAF